MPSKPTLPPAQSFSRRRQLDIASSNAQLQRRIESLELHAKALETQIHGMAQSSSWRVTAPLRWLAAAIQRLRYDASRDPAKTSGSYVEWLSRYDTPSAAELQSWRLDIAAARKHPRLAVLVGHQAGGLASLRAALQSLDAQVYTDWDLHLVSSGAVEPEAQALVEVAPRFKPGPPSGAEWIVWLEPGCTLASQALLCMASEIVTHPEARMLYADTDAIDLATGLRSDPDFRPDWNPDLFLARNLFTPLGAVEARLLDEAGGVTEGVEATQAFDLALRCVERVKPSQIRHIPRILSHSSEPFVAPDPAPLSRFFERTGIAATADETPHGRRVRYALPAELPLVSIVIPTRNALGLVQQCVESIVHETAWPNYEILLIDNGSDDPDALAYFAALNAQPNITVLRDDRPFNYSALNNGAVMQARGELVVLLNNDIEIISPDWLHEMASLALQPGVGAVGAKLLYPDMNMQHAGIVLGIGGLAGHAHKHMPSDVPGHGGRAQLVQTFSAVTAACLVVRKALYEQVGGLDEDALGVAYNDVDFCLRLRAAGYRNVWTPYAQLLHHESASRGLEMAAAARERLARESTVMRSRWSELIAHDPAYNPNLTLEAEDFGLAWPPRAAPSISAS